MLITLVILYPFVTLLAQSLSSSGAIKAGLVNVVPVGFNLDTYRAVTGDDRFWTSYGNTVLYTVVGTVIAMVLTTTFAYAISKHAPAGPQRCSSGSPSSPCSSTAGSSRTTCSSPRSA